MRVLAFDCSTARGSLAVVEAGRTLFAEAFDCPRGRGGAFFQILERAVRTVGKPDRISVGIGPGSYNGLRTAIAAAEGLRLAVGAEIAGVASVRALPCEAREYFAINDARGGVFYCGRLRNRELAGGFELLDLESLGARLSAEPGVPVLASASVTALPAVRVAFPDAVILAELGAREAISDGPVEPIYLKPAHITKPRVR